MSATRTGGQTRTEEALVLSRELLSRIAYAVGILLVVYGSAVPGREVAIGGGMSLIAGTVGAKALNRQDDEEGSK